jgi:TolA-binding protein
MAEARARISFADVRASVKRMQTEGEKLVTRLRRDAQSLATRTRRETVSSLLTDARKLRTDIRDRAEKAIKDIDSQRERILASIEEQGSRLVERVVKGLNLVSAQDLASLNKRLGDIERRLQELSKERALSCAAKRLASIILRLRGIPEAAPARALSRRLPALSAPRTTAPNPPPPASRPGRRSPFGPWNVALAASARTPPRAGAAGRARTRGARAPRAPRRHAPALAEERDLGRGARNFDLTDDAVAAGVTGRDRRSPRRIAYAAIAAG